MNFKPLLNSIELHYKLSTETMMNLEDICKYWTVSTEETIENIKDISRKYAFENLINIRRPDSESTRLEFWKDIGQFSLVPALDDHDIDLDFIQFVEDFGDKATFRSQIEIPENEIDSYYECLDRLFYTWIGFTWQSANGRSSGIPTCTVENNSVIMFYLNDFLFDDLSSYYLIQGDQRITGSAFNRNLSPLEIYARTNRNINRKDREIVWEFRKGEETITLTVKNSSTTINSLEFIEVKLHKPSKNYDNSHDIAKTFFIKTCDQYINDNWILSELKCK